MSTMKLVRWAGLVLIVGALIDLATTIGGQGEPTGDQPLSQLATTTGFIVTWALNLLVSLLLTLGMVGLYARQAGKAGVLGLVAFVVAMAGLILSSGVNWTETFVVPSLAVAGPEFLDALVAGEPVGMVGLGLPLSLITFLVGFTLMGISSAVSKALPAWAAWGLVAGTVLAVVLGMLGAPIVPGVAFDAGLGAAGYALWSGKEGTYEARPSRAAGLGVR